MSYTLQQIGNFVSANPAGPGPIHTLVMQGPGRAGLPANLRYGLISCWICGNYGIQFQDNVVYPSFNNSGSGAKFVFSASDFSGDGYIGLAVGNAIIWSNDPITPIADTVSKNILVSFDAVASIVQVYVNDVEVTGGGAYPTPGTTTFQSNMALFGSTQQITPTTGEAYLGDFYFGSPASFFDLSVEANRRKFIDAGGAPVSLGTDGSVPTGTAPAIFLHTTTIGTLGDFQANNATSITAAVVMAVTSHSLYVPGAAFSAGDVGKSINVFGAGFGGSALQTTIAAYVDAQHLTLAAAAVAGLNGSVNSLVQYGTNGPFSVQTGALAWEPAGLCGISVPANLISTATTTSSISMAWDASGGGGFTYSLRYRKTGASSWSMISGLTVTTQTVSGLDNGTFYDFQVMASVGTSNSGWSSTVSVETVPVPAVPFAQPAFLGNFRGRVGLNWNGKVLIGDAYSGVVGLANFDTFSEYGFPMTALVTTPPIHNDRKRIFVNRFEIDVQSGVGDVSGAFADPVWMLDWSKDGGRTWVPLVLPRSMGKVGEYQKRLRWLKLGESRQWIFRLRATDSVRRVIIGTYADVKEGMG